MSRSPIPVVILHGWNHSSTTWEAAHQFLDPDRYQLTIPDLPGFGQNQSVPDNWNIPEYAKWATTYIEKEVLKSPKKDFYELNSVVLLGHSFGGRITSYIAAQNPAWLQKIILYAAPLLYRPTIHTRIKILTYKLGKILTFNSKILREYIAHAHHAELHHADQQNMGQIYRQVVNFDQTELLPKIKVPTHIIIGTNDHEVRLHIARESHQLISGSQLHELIGEGHNIHLDHPNLFYGLIRRILSNA
ncbi:MAG: alpha/beta hydrolase [Patescibacteria group bacterium]|nr:MAG: alpha/beta hydrolase [Patescibacteria group bacterium]